MSPPRDHRGLSRQDYCTPAVFLDAVRARFGRLDWDLASTSTNAVAPLRLDDSLNQDWGRIHGNLWLNPPFGDIAPWARKCAATPCGPDRRILLLTPASVGAKWFDHVWGHAKVFALRGRLSFDGKTPFPKDCMLSVYGVAPVGFEIWDWRLPAPSTRVSDGASDEARAG